MILIAKQRIVAVGDRTTQIPPRATRMEATGKFLIPGLVDAEAHLVDGTAAPALIGYEGRYDEVAIEAAQIALKHGITTIFDPWEATSPSRPRTYGLWDRRQ